MRFSRRRSETEALGAPLFSAADHQRVAYNQRMNSTPQNPAALLRRYGLRPHKNLGQNFLVDEAALQKITQAAEIQPDETVLEIGPGLGGLTRHLARAARRVVCVELDRALIPILEDQLQDYPNVELVQGDILKLDLRALVGGAADEPGYLVVANIPYYITSTLLRKLLETAAPPRRLALTVQRAVAERACATAGELSLLGLSVQVYGRAQIVAHIPAGAFYPPPKVDSAVIRADLYPEPVVARERLPLFFRLAKAGFAQKRKTLRNSLAGGMHWQAQGAAEILAAAEIDPMRRAETLSLDEWRRLTQVVEALAPPDHEQPREQA
ncbi:MAG: 16S rRNA (adenine(1518)-N(6)/adenine(1519)-N(6))-dimethyltransferase RsmA [Anaerolineales bacterium]|nr:16S rRNA (adenine(1518)-N(6)/adenine(1519)-N(6))-dimethyltransferase RsmA [Anaerolineales bacterium]